MPGCEIVLLQSKTGRSVYKDGSQAHSKVKGSQQCCEPNRVCKRFFVAQKEA